MTPIRGIAVSIARFQNLPPKVEAMQWFQAFRAGSVLLLRDAGVDMDDLETFEIQCGPMGARVANALEALVLRNIAQVTLADGHKATILRRLVDGGTMVDITLFQPQGEHHA